MPSQVMQQKESQGHSWLMFALGIGIGVGVGLGVGVVMAATIPSAKVAAVTVGAAAKAVQVAVY